VCHLHIVSIHNAEVVYENQKRLARCLGSVSVRFNDLGGNAFVGLRIGSNQTTSIDATCNWWGHLSGPSGTGSGRDRCSLAIRQQAHSEIGERSTSK